MLTDTGKTYEAVLLLGQSTDTQDTTGTVLRTCPVNADEKQVRECLAGFVGPYLQVPPMYSALKVNGKKLYELARAGIEVERKPRPVQIYGIEIRRVNLPEVFFLGGLFQGNLHPHFMQRRGRPAGMRRLHEKPEADQNRHI